MKQIGNVGQVSDTAMTANYGDETDDGVCEHEDWVFISNTLQFGSRSIITIMCKIRCMMCLEEGWLTTEMKEYELEWNK